jgi:exonuclease III
VIGKGFEEYVKKEDPDVICLQETKYDPKKVDSKILSNYDRYFSAGAKVGHHGTG